MPTTTPLTSDTAASWVPMGLDRTVGTMVAQATLVEPERRSPETSTVSSRATGISTAWSS